MAAVNIKTPPTDASVDELRRWAEETSRTLQFILTHIDEHNVTAAFAKKIEGGRNNG